MSALAGARCSRSVIYVAALVDVHRPSSASPSRRWGGGGSGSGWLIIAWNIKKSVVALPPLGSCGTGGRRWRCSPSTSTAAASPTTSASSASTSPNPSPPTAGSFGGVLPTQFLQAHLCGVSVRPGRRPPGVVRRRADHRLLLALLRLRSAWAAAALGAQPCREWVRYMRRYLSLTARSRSPSTSPYPMAPPWMASRDGYVTLGHRPPHRPGAGPPR